MVLSGSGRWCDPVDSVECMTWRDRSSRCWSMGKKGGGKFFWGGRFEGLTGAIWREVRGQSVWELRGDCVVAGGEVWYPVDDQSTGINIDHRPDMVSTG